jgi:hypothetical protein
MPDWLLSRPTVIALAIGGGAFSLLASWCKSRGILSAQQVIWLNKTAYGFMAASIILFIIVVFVGAST